MASDNFNRANESPLASPWISVTGLANGGLSLSSNKVINNTGTGGDQASLNSNSQVGDSQVTISTVNDADGGPVICASQNPFNGYTVTNYVGSAIEIYKITNGSFSFIASASGSYAANDQIRLRRSGNNIISSKNGSQLSSQSDTTYMTGYDGIFLYNSMIVDDWTNGVSDSWTPSLSALIVRNK